MSLPTLRGAAAVAAGILLLVGCTPPAAAPEESGTPLATTSVTTIPTGDAPSAGLRLMSFNILTSDPVIFTRNPLVPHEELAFSARAPQIARMIRTADPDLVALQENFGDPVPYDLLRDRLPGYAWVKPDEQVSILVRESRFTVEEAGYRDLHRTQKGFLSWARVRDVNTGGELWVFDVHLRAGRGRAEARIRSAEVVTLRAIMAGLNPGNALPAIVMGDLNTSSKEKRALFRDPVVKLSGDGLVDAATVAVRDASNVQRADTPHGFDARVGHKTHRKVVRRTGLRFDFIFVPGAWHVASFAVVTGPTVERTVVSGHRVYRWVGVVPSDHSPVVADIELPR
ncbi:MAG TPA: endonuclease/exonuclease/phosphatase family protein [Propionicimonas sp.]|jgi:endonuclease/exonuclease/phosphatase family metal-dependent hydrolase